MPIPTPTSKMLEDAAGNLPMGIVLKRRYRIMRKIAQGGMGAVYESADLTVPSGMRWAIKEMSPATLPANERTQAIADFRREAQMLAALHHPNLPQVVETFEEMGKHFLVMEFIPGRTLLNMSDGTLGFTPEERVIVWARQLFDVLQYLHSQNPPIVYRDLKPANIMLMEGTERVKLIDFGIARFHKAGKSRDTEAFGTAGYAPPEQYGKGQTDQRSDIYALAATLHQLITKHDPSLNPFNWLPASRYNPAVSPRLESALQTALNLDPARRFASIKDFAEAVGIYLPAAPAEKPLSWEKQPLAPAPAKSQRPPAPVAPTLPAPAKSAAQPKTGRKKSRQTPAAQPPYTPLPIPAAVPAASMTATALESLSRPSANTPAVPPSDLGSPSPSPTNSVREANVVPPATAKPWPGEKEQQEVAVSPPASLVVSERLVDLGEVRWNSKTARKIALSSSGGKVRGTVLASQPWIAYNPQQFQGNAVTLEVKVKKRDLPLGRTELQVPNLFAIIWARTRRVLPLIGCWFWLVLLVASALGRILLWGAAALIAGLLIFEALMWLWAAHVRLLVPAERVNTGRLTVKSSGGDQQIEVRALARPSWGRKALGWTAALLLFTAEVGAAVWIALALTGFEIYLPGI